MIKKGRSREMDIVLSTVLVLKGAEKFKLKSTAENNSAELFVKLLVELPRD